MIKPGDMIEIVVMEGEPTYSGRRGTVTSIGVDNALFGTWGELPVIPDMDTFKVTTSLPLGLQPYSSLSEKETTDDEEDIFLYYPCPSCMEEDCEHCSFLDAEDEYLLFDKTL